MKLPKEHNIQQIAEMIDAQVIDQGVGSITGINEIHKVEHGDITFVDHPKYYMKALHSKASVIIINKMMDCPEGKALLFCEDPFIAYNKLTRHFRPYQSRSENIGENTEIGEGTELLPGSQVGNNVKIGRNCLIHSNVVIYDHTEIGDNVIIHANTTIGSDAFYFRKKTNYEKLYSCGRVIIEDDVEIGSNCSIDKGVSGDTVIGRGSKLDNQVHIGHGVETGSNCLFAAHVGIAGKTTIGNDVILWGQVGVSKDLHIGDRAVVLAQSGVGKSIEGNKVYFGSPVQDAKEKMKEMALAKRLPEIWEKVKDLE